MQRGRVTYSVGNENNPGNPFGRSDLAIEPDGAAKLEHHQRGKAAQSFAGTVATDKLDRLWAALDRAKFPDWPKHPIPGGSTLRELTVGGTSALPFEFNAAKKLPGYDEAFAVLDEVIAELSNHSIKRT